MGDIELVIKISKKAYNALTHTEFDANLVVDEMRKSIAHGTPLPKGHGRLIDADKAVREENSKLVDFETTNTRDRSYCRYARMILNDASTIIEADKERSEE